MTSQRALAGVAHDIAHHAVSGVSYVHPHLHQACQAVGVREASVDLVVADPYPPGLPQVEPLRLALSALRDRFFGILAANGYGPTDIQSATLRFQFPLIGGDGYSCQATAVIESSSGRRYSAILEQAGA
jgi:hypothetical protein